MKNMEVRIDDRTTLSSPVCIAAGVFEHDNTEQYNLSSAAGALFIKSITKDPRAGNPFPRMFKFEKHLLNSMGLPNPGVKAFISKKLPLLASMSPKIFVSVAGSSAEEYEYLVQSIEDADTKSVISGWELNLSCPNVHEGGRIIGESADMVSKVTKSVRKKTKRTLIVKLAPMMSNIESLARAAEDAGADAISTVNTAVGMLFDTKTGKPVFALKTAGLSGPALLPIGVAVVYRISRVVQIPIIGVGGITKKEDALQYLLAGASAVQIATAMFQNPSIYKETYEAIKQFCSSRHLSDLKEIQKISSS